MSVTNSNPPPRTIEFIDSTGKRTPVSDVQPEDYFFPTFSPDGTRIAAMVIEGQRQGLYVYDIAQNIMSKLPSGGRFFTGIVWTPDGKTLILGSTDGGFFSMRADGSSQPQQLMVEGGTKHTLVSVSSMSRDGKLAYSEFADGNNTASHLWILPVQVNGGSLSAGRPEPFLRTSVNQPGPKISPNEKWIAYSSNESGRPEIYVRPLSSSSSQRWQISDKGGTNPTWSRIGNELFYRAGQDIVAVSYTADGDTFVRGKPRTWLSKLGEGNVNWDLDPTRDRIVVTRPVASAPAPVKQEHTVMILKNFLDELRRRAPAN